MLYEKNKKEKNPKTDIINGLFLAKEMAAVCFPLSLMEKVSNKTEFYLLYLEIAFYWLYSLSSPCITLLVVRN